MTDGLNHDFETGSQNAVQTLFRFCNSAASDETIPLGIYQRRLLEPSESLAKVSQQVLRLFNCAICTQLS
jgi:hypothetical protein